MSAEDIIEEIEEGKEKVGKYAYDPILSNGKKASAYVIAASGDIKKKTHKLPQPNLAAIAKDNLNYVDKNHIVRCAISGSQSSSNDFGITMKAPTLSKQFYQTGIFAFDSGLTQDITNPGGIPKGSVSLFYGDKGGGKSSLGLRAVKLAQDLGEPVAWINLERSLHKGLVEAWGIDVEAFEPCIYEPEDNDAYATFNLISFLVKSGVKLIVVDSITVLNFFRTENTNIIAPEQMGKSGIGFGQFLKQILPGISKNNTALFCISQVRTDLGVVYGDNKTYPGGLAWGHYADLIVYVNKYADWYNIHGSALPSRDSSGENTVVKKLRLEKDLQNFPVIGISGTMVVKKNRMSGVLGQYVYEYFFNKGFDSNTHVIFELKKNGIVIQKGAWYYELDDAGVELKPGWQGLAKFKAAISGDKDLFDRLFKRMYDKAEKAKFDYVVNDEDVMDGMATKKLTERDNRTKTQQIADAAADGGGGNLAMTMMAHAIEADDELDTVVDQKTGQKKKISHIADEESVKFLDSMEISEENLITEESEMSAMVGAISTEPLNGKTK